MSHNRLQQIPKSLFAGFRNLRVIDLSHNELRTLEENAFRDSILEKVDLSNNHLSKVPIYSFDVNSGETLSELDLSENLIVTLPPPEAFVKFKVLKNCCGILLHVS